MAATPTRTEVHYPESDGKPMAETTFHREVMMELIIGLQDWFADDPMAYVSGNDFLYYVEGNPRRHVSPDVWVARGIDKTVSRPAYKTWLEGGKGPDLVIEVTSPSTRREDRGKKFRIYRDDLKVREYIQFDPLGEYLDPPLQGYRLVEGEYFSIEPEAGRLPSEVLALHLEAEGAQIRLFDPAAGRRLLTRAEALREKDATIQEKDAAIQEKDAAIQEKDAAIQEKDAAIRRAEEANERLLRELEALRPGQKPSRK